MLQRIFIALFFVLLVACSKITSENYVKIKTNMSYAEVVKLLGKPTDQQSVKVMHFSATNATWQHKDKTISIQFLDDKVKMKSFVDEDQKAQPRDPAS